MKQLTFPHASSIKMTAEQALSLGIDITQEEIRGELNTVGPWNIVKSYKALCIDTLYVRNEWKQAVATEVTFFGPRTMTNASMTQNEGWVSIKSKKYSCFTSSVLVEVNDKLINVACICARYTSFPE